MTYLEEKMKELENMNTMIAIIMWISIFGTSICIGLWQHSWLLGLGIFFYLIMRAYKQ